MKTRNTKDLTSTNLQNVLWETLNQVKSKRIRPNEANAIAAQAREICRISKITLEHMRLTGSKMTKNNGILQID